MIADSVSAELGIIKNELYTELRAGMKPSAVEDALFSATSVTATLVFVHHNPFDPLDSNQSITTDNDSTLGKKDLPTQENHSQRSNSGSSSSNDAKNVIPPQKVSVTRRLFEPDKDSKPNPTRWPTPKSVLTMNTNLVSNASTSVMPTPPLDSFVPTSVSGSGSKDPVSTRAANLSGAPLTNINTDSVLTCSSLFTPPPDDQPLSKQSTPPPPPARARLGCPPPSPAVITTEYVCGTETDHEPESNPQHRSESDSKHVGEDGTKKTNETPPPRKRAALVYRNSPPQQNKLPDKQLGSPPREVGTGHVSSQKYLTEEELSPNATIPDANFFALQVRDKSTPTPAQHKQNPWDLFGTPDAVKIYSALTSGLAFGALAAVSVPSAPVLASIAGITAGGVVGYAIAEKISRDMEKKRNENNATRL